MPFFGSLGILIARGLIVAAVVVYLFSEILTLVGNGLPGFFDGSVRFNLPRGVAFDSAGNMYVADTNNHRIRKITPLGVVTTLAGSGSLSFQDGTGTSASFWNPFGVAVDSVGNVFVADSTNNRIRKITPAGVVSTFAGQASVAFSEGTGTSATFNQPSGVAFDSAGNLYVADYGNHRIRKITPLAVVSTFAGTTQGFQDGEGTNVRFSFPRALALDSAGNVYVADFGNQRIRKITPLGVVSTLAGSVFGSTDGTGTNATFSSPQALTVDSAGNVYVGDFGNNRIRKITPLGVVTTFAGQTAGFANGIGTNASFNNPSGVALDSVGNFYIADHNNHRIRKITATGIVTTFAGSGVSGFTDSEQPGAGSSFFYPRGLALDSAGNLYVADEQNSRIRKITAAGVVSTLAGSSLGFQDGTGTNAKFWNPYGVAVDSAGTVYVADTGNYRIRKITPGGVVTTFAGSGTSQFGDGNGTDASFSSPQGIAVDSNGTVYVVDTGNFRIRKITSGGFVTTFAGDGFSGNINGANSRFTLPKGITINSAGTMMYITDSHYIRRITSGGVSSFLGGRSTAGSANGIGANATFRNPWGITVDSGDTSVYVADTDNHTIRKVTTNFGEVTKYAGFGGPGFVESPLENVLYNSPFGIVINSSGTIYLADMVNNRIRRIPYGASSGGLPVVIGGSPSIGFTDGGGWFNALSGVATDWDGTVYVADRDNHRIRKITSTGVVSNFAGSGEILFADGTGTTASFSSPQGIAVGPNRTVYVADTGNFRIRKITPGAFATTFAGSGTTGFADGTGAGATFNTPVGITVDPLNTVYVSDIGNHNIRRITSAGVVTSLAGSRTATFADGVGTNASFNTPSGIVADIYGNVYVADTNNHCIRRITSDGTVTTLAGSTPGYVDGTGTNAQFNFPYHLSIDSLGILYVADQTNNRIRKIQPSTGVVTTLAGDGTAGFTFSSFSTPQGITVDRFRQAYVGDNANHSIRKIVDVYTLPENNGVVTTIAGDGTAQFLDGNGIGTRFNLPRGVGVDSVGNVYVGDTIGHRIRKITPAGVVTTFAGNGTPSFLDGTGTNARFSSPWGVAADSEGNIYVGDSSNHRIRKISPLGVVSTLAGLSGSFGDGTGTNARFNQPQAVAVDREGNVYVADQSNHRIRKITPAAVVTTVAGQINPGFANGQGTSAQFNGPAGVAVDSEGNLYVADYGNHRIRRITSGSPSAYPPGVVSTLAGSGTASFVNGTGTNATFRFPRGLTVDSAGNVYVADESNHCIRKITPAGVVTTLAGTTQGFQDGVGTNARFNFPVGMSVDSVGNVYVGDRTNNRIRKIGTAVAQLPLNRGVVTTFAGSATAGATNATGTNATFANLTGVAVDSQGNLYIADTANNRIRKISPGGVVTTLAGSTQGSTNGTGTNASFRGPRAVAVDSAGNVYVADTENSLIRKISPLGVVSTLAGSTYEYLDGTGTNARFKFPYGVAVDSAGIVYVSDGDNHRIRKITSTGVVTTLAGSGSATFADGTGTNASFNSPQGIAVDSAGFVYVVEFGNHRIRKITPLAVVSTFAGTTQGSTNGTGTNASFRNPNGVAVDSDGNVYIGDTNNGLIRKITPAGVVTTLAGTTQGFQDGVGTNATFSFPEGIAVDSGGIVYVADRNNNRIRKIQ